MRSLISRFNQNIGIMGVKSIFCYFILFLNQSLNIQALVGDYKALKDPT